MRFVFMSLLLSFFLSKAHGQEIDFSFDVEKYPPAGVTSFYSLEAYKIDEKRFFTELNKINRKLISNKMKLVKPLDKNYCYDGVQVKNDNGQYTLYLLNLSKLKLDQKIELGILETGVCVFDKEKNLEICYPDNEAEFYTKYENENYTVTSFGSKVDDKFDEKNTYINCDDEFENIKNYLSPDKLVKPDDSMANGPYIKYMIENSLSFKEFGEMAQD